MLITLISKYADLESSLRATVGAPTTGGSALGGVAPLLGSALDPGLGPDLGLGACGSGGGGLNSLALGSRGCSLGGWW